MLHAVLPYPAFGGPIGTLCGAFASGDGVVLNRASYELHCEVTCGACLAKLEAQRVADDVQAALGPSHPEYPQAEGYVLDQLGSSCFGVTRLPGEPDHEYRLRLHRFMQTGVAR